MGVGGRGGELQCVEDTTTSANLLVEEDDARVVLQELKVWEWMTREEPREDGER